jgi:hypothetical protein
MSGDADAWTTGQDAYTMISETTTGGTGLAHDIFFSYR